MKIKNKKIWLIVTVVLLLVVFFWQIFPKEALAQEPLPPSLGDQLFDNAEGLVKGFVKDKAIKTIESIGAGAFGDFQAWGYRQGAALFFGLASWSIHYIIEAAGYNEFLNSPVNAGWMILRDICNMFFIVLFIFIAFATVLKKEQYAAKKMLLPFVLAAIFVNFSKTICGIAIDAVQVVTLTFVTPLREVAGGNMGRILGLEQFGDIAKNLDGGLKTTADFQLNLSWMLAMLMGFVAMVVCFIILILFVLRIFAIWILIILSPFAFVLYLVPGGQTYAKEWQTKFISQLLIGPMLAFFLWFSFYVVQQGNAAAGLSFGLSFSEGSVNVGGSVYGQPSTLASFTAGICMLIASLMAAQKLKAVGAGLAGKGISFIQKSGAAAAKTAGKAATYFPKQYGKRAGYELGDKALGAMGNLPFIGNAMIKYKTKLKAHRELAEEKDTRWMQSASEDDMRKIVNRGQRFMGGGWRARAFQGESGRNTWLQASDWMAQKGQTHEYIKPKKGDSPAVKEQKEAENRAFVTRWIRDYQKASGHRLDHHNNDTYRNEKRGKEIEQWLFLHPHLIAENNTAAEQAANKKYGIDKINPKTKKRDNYRINPKTEEPFEGIEGKPQTEREYRITRNPRLFSQMSHDVMALYPEVGQDLIVKLLSSITESNMSDAQTATDEVNKGGKATEPAMQYLYRDYSMWTKTGSPQLNSETLKRQADLSNPTNMSPLAIEFRNLLDRKFPKGWVLPKGGGQFTVGEAVNARRAAPDEKIKERLRTTDELYQKHGEEYENDPEYQKNKDRYLPLKEYKSMRQVQTQAEEVTSLTSDSDVITGTNNTIKRAERAKSRGAASYDYARVGIDFEKFGEELGLSGPEQILSGEVKDKLISQISEILRKQGKSETDVKSFEDSAKMADQLMVIDRGRTFGEIKRSHAHERMHMRVDQIDPEVKKKALDTLSLEEKQTVRADVRKRWGRPDMSDEEADDEYLAEGLTNETRWAKSDGVRLSEKVKNSLQQQTGLSMASLTSNLTGWASTQGQSGGQQKDFSLAAILATLPEAINGAISGVSFIPPELVPAIKALGPSLKEVGGGLFKVAKLNPNLNQLGSTISTTSFKTGLLVNQLLMRIRENSAGWKKSSERLAGLDKKYNSA